MSDQSRVSLAWKLLRYSYGAVILLAGLDKVFATDLIVEWAKYVSPTVAASLPVSVGAFLVIIGIIEVAVAALTFSRFTVLASYISAAWLVLISINLLMIGGYVDVAIRDVLLAIAAIATAQLGVSLGYGLYGKEVSSIDA